MVLQVEKAGGLERVRDGFGYGLLVGLGAVEEGVEVDDLMVGY